MPYADTLHHASWRGVPFGVEAASQRGGRRLARHDYPYRDQIWLEDQGKRAPEFRIVGFLIGNSAVYGGGDVRSQRDRMLSALEAKGSGQLVHPSRGRLTVTLAEYDIAERWDQGNYFEIVFSFVQSGEQLFPAVLAALSSLVSGAAGLADAAGLGSFVDKVAGPLEKGLDAASSIATTADQWLDKAESLARDATGLYGTLSQLGGANFGRYFNGRNSGFLSGLTSPYAGVSSVADLIKLGSAQRAAVSDAATAVKAAIGGLGAGVTAADVATQAQATVAALAASAADPQDGVRILGDLAKFVPGGAATTGAVGLATSDLFQRAAAAAIGRVSATYAPASADDAHAVRDAVLAPVQAAIARAGATGEDDVFSAFRSLRKAVVQDLGDRGAALPGLAELSFAANLPSVVLAQRRYGDASRGDELVTQADPVHPWFMPDRFKALAH